MRERKRNPSGEDAPVRQPPPLSPQAPQVACREIENAKMITIPRIIHQSWKTTEIPVETYKVHWVESWKELHPDWRHILWTDEDNRRLVAEHYPQYLGFYDQLHPPIKKADFCRFLYMHHLGGVYVDLDFLALRNVEPMLVGSEIVVGSLSEKNHYYQIPNAFMASVAGHEFWMQVATDSMNAPLHEQGVEMQSGPFRLQWAIDVYQPRGLDIIDHRNIYPLDWIHFVSWGCPDEGIQRLARELVDKPREEILEHFPDAFAVTFWSHNW
jgi:mannosyltransferase OCH1-like enzyme